MELSPAVKLSWVTDFIKAKLIGNPNYLVTGINEIHMVHEGDITFVDHPKYYSKALNSAATVIIIDKETEAPEGKHLLISDDPFRDYNKLTKHFRPFERANKPISDTAEIGEGTIIQPGVFIGNHVKIGKNCIIHSNVSIYDDTIIGDDCVIQANAVIGGDAFYFKLYEGKGRVKMHSCGRAILHDKVEVGANCTVDRGVSGDTVIGEGTKLDNLIHIGHDSVIGKNCVFAAQVGIAGVVIIEDNVSLWGQVGVSKDLIIGKGASVMAQSGVSKTLEGGKDYFGSPAREARLKWKEMALVGRLPELFNKEDKE
jgi:UDP-3-O-[3-hydroxymyristoyl] glucosamine N-acyltransferase